ncbi:MAG: ABC transporter substrate-binding protein [Paracoccaceae bacterium]|jgi:iron complex transport system substrate-binding protein|nr:ABC transporter substrate-binding protein [Paracoccaceae bacterium]
MSVFRPRSERAGRRPLRAAGIALAALIALAGPARADAPERVVSINLCTDQLALMLAAPGQLVSVSRMAHDPRSSAMAEAARRLPANSALAEDVFLHRPDLVLAGTFTSRATVSMLRRLGVEVVELAPAYALGDVRDRLRAVGAALGREAEAELAVARFDSDLAALQAELAERPRAALYYANGYTNGDRTLAGDIIAAAGFANVATELGLARGGYLALEQLVMAAPELVVTGQPQRGEARAEAVLTHPALEATGGGRATTTDRDWICGTPHVLRAVRQMSQARTTLEPATDKTSGRHR